MLVWSVYASRWPRLESPGSAIANTPSRINHARRTSNSRSQLDLRSQESVECRRGRYWARSWRFWCWVEDVKLARGCLEAVLRVSETGHAATIISVGRLGFRLRLPSPVGRFMDINTFVVRPTSISSMLFNAFTVHLSKSRCRYVEAPYLKYGTYCWVTSLYRHHLSMDAFEDGTHLLPSSETC
ncbi:hypothetical protein BC629DRAFT_271325 [Irpex lacteus]|nr:hypothetical protein BC629DRAFT_271325 [Irpex lacteus]